MKKIRQTKDVTKSVGNAGPMDTVLLEKLVALMAANDLSAVDLRDGAKRIILKRGAQVAAVPAPVAAPVHVAPAMVAAPAPAPAAKSAPAEDAGLKEIKSPMVGTFYSKPSPDSKPFVSVGSAISEDTDVCVIEAMKVFNNIKAECRGTIAKICVSDGQPVEFGTVLFLVKP